MKPYTEYDLVLHQRCSVHTI